MTISRTIRFAALAMAAAFWMHSAAMAQLFSPDPYDPYGRAYRSYAYPNAGDNPSLPNATRFPQGPGGGGSRANQLEGFMNDPSMNGLGGRSSRFDGSSRRFSRNIVEEPSNAQKADAKYFEEREKREQAMIRAMLERDPKKRDQMVRDAQKDAAKSGTALGASVRRGASPANVPAAPALRARRANDRTNSASTSRTGSAPAPAPKPAAGERAARGDVPPPPPPPAGSSRSRSSAAPSLLKPSQTLLRNRRLGTVRPSDTAPNAGALPPSNGAPR